MKSDIVNIIIKSLKEQEIDNLVIVEEDLEQTPLYGRESALDSLDLVSLIVDVESALSVSYNVEVTLASERAMSQKRSPFRSVETLANYIIEVMEDYKNG
jgi:acyl carrier protein